MCDAKICNDCDPNVYLFVKTENITFYDCSRCEKKLCNQHFIRAKENGKHYGYGENYAMCDQCCWFEVG